MTMPRILSLENVTTGYNGKEIIRGVSFDLNKGDVLAVIGPNGSGKTTLLNAILGILPVKSGRIVFELKDAQRENSLAYIPQRLDIDRTFPISLKEMLGLSLNKPDISKYIEMLELDGLLDNKVGELSGGQMQRALLAYAIIKEPELLLMDEPTSWIDAKGADCILCIMEEFQKKGIAMIIVSHDFTVLKSVSTKVLGLGPEGHFIENAHSPDINSKIASLFGTMHHNSHTICRIR